MYKKLSILALLILVLILPILFFTILDIEQDTFEPHDKGLQQLEKQTISKGITVYSTDAFVLGRYENKIYLDTPTLSEVDTESEVDTDSGQIELFPEAKNIQFISVNEEYLVGVNNNSIQGYDRRTKELLWEKTYDDVLLHVALSPIEDNILYFATSNIVYKINVSTGRMKNDYMMYDGFDHNPRIHLFEDFVVYFGDAATYIFDKDLTLLKKLEPMSNPFTDGDNIYYMQRSINEDVNEQKTIIKKYSLSKDEVEIISEINYYEVLGFIGIGDNQELYLDMNLISEPGIAVIKDGKNTFKGTGYSGSAMETYPSGLVSLSGYYNGYIYYIFNRGEQFYYQSSQEEQPNLYNRNEINLNSNENPNEKKGLFNTRLIDNYLYVQGENRLIEINLEEVLE